MSEATLAVNHAAAKVNVQAVRDVADDLLRIYDQLRPLVEEGPASLAEAYSFQGSYESNTDGFDALHDKLEDENGAIHATASRLREIAEDMQKTVDLFTAEHLAQLQASQASVVSFVDGGMTTQVFQHGTTITGSGEGGA